MKIDRMRVGLPVLLETAHELAVVKPAGMATELTSDPNGVSLLSRVRAAYAGDVVPRLPHRLDRVARGIVVVALSEGAIRYHNEQIRARTWRKLYLARVHASQRAFADLLGGHRVHLRRVNDRATVVRCGGKPASLEILGAHSAPSSGDQAHVLIRPLTGRFHQIRAMMAHLAAPLVGDRLYGPVGDPEFSFYLEHIALGFRPLGGTGFVLLHRRDDPDREPIAPQLQEKLDTLLIAWTLEEGG